MRRGLLSSSYAGLTRVSITLGRKHFPEGDGWPGHLARRRASRFRPAMTSCAFAGTTIGRASNLNARFSERSSRRNQTLFASLANHEEGDVMERRHFLKLALGFAGGAAALAATANAAPLLPVSPQQNLVPPRGNDAQPAVTTQDDVDRLKPEEVRWGHHGHGHWHRHWHRRHWGWHRHRWHRRHWGWHRHRWHRRHWGWHRHHWHRHRW